MSLCVKVANKKYPFFQAVFTRSIFQVIGSFIGCKIIKINPWGHPDYRFLLVARGACGAIGMTLFFAGMTYLPLADNTVVFFSGPAITAIIAWFILDEKLTFWDSFLSSISLLGVVLVAKPEFIFPSDSDNDYIDLNTIYCLLPFFGACMGSFAYILVRYIGYGVHFLVHVMYFGIVSSVISGFALFIFHTQYPIFPESLFDWVIHILIAVSGFIGQCLLNKSIQLCAAGPGTMLRNLDVVFAFIIGIIILDEIPKWNSVVGALAIIGCSICMGIRKLKPKEREPTEVAVAISIEEALNDELYNTDI